LYTREKRMRYKNQSLYYIHHEGNIRYFNFKNSYQFMGKYDNKKSHISEFSEKNLIFIAYSRDYESYNKIVSLYPLYSVSEKRG